jgi:eukaryotic-like serine/threonine-protein kinase
VRWLSDKALDHLRRLAEEPDLNGTKYELVEKLGQGGMGTVYRCRDRDLGRDVALKVLSLPPADAQARDRMLQEARIIARLEHPEIVPVHDVGTLPDGRVYYAMKLVRGRRLDEPTDAPLSERLRMFEKVCQAVAFAHAHGVLHRDLKPQNIMVGAFGEVLVMDWGLAKEAGACSASKEPSPLTPGPCPLPSEPKTQAGAVLGTPGYMAPEQARGGGDRVDERTDVYALGGILTFLLGGCGPRPLEAVCRKALAPEPVDRYASVAELAADVARFLAGQRVTAYPESILDTTRRLFANYRVAVLLILAYLAMRILLLVFARM